VNLALPDEELRRAYDWSRVSMVSGAGGESVSGTGLVAGYRTSGESQRPGFAWFFGATRSGRNSGSMPSAILPQRGRARFLKQISARKTVKVPHEIAQSASLVSWFKDYPYGFASADATPLFIVAMDDYVQHSGDIEFARSKWDNLEKAYNFLRSTYDAQGLPKNFGVGPRMD